MKRFKWTVEIEVDETWVADGFDVTDEWIANTMQKMLSWARGDEVGGRVLTRPADEDIAKAQGYASVKEWQHVNSRKKAVSS